MERDCPSSVTGEGFVMAPKAKAPEWLLTTPAPSSCKLLPYFVPVTTVLVDIAVDSPPRTTSSGFPTSVWKLQSKIR